MKRTFKKDDIVVFTKKPSGVHMYGRKNWVGHVGVVVEPDAILIITKFGNASCYPDLCLIISCSYEEIEYIGSLN